MTDQYAVIGNPVAHSKSPAIHAEFARQLGHDISYVVIHAELDAFEATVHAFRSKGGRGMNVTLPFKHRAYALARERTPRAEDARAVNTLVLDTPNIGGDNTDGAGLVRDITVNLGCALRGSRILLLGAGGASYGVAGPLLDEAPASLAIANRTFEKAVELREQFSSAKGAAELLAIGYDALPGRQFDVVINATSAGLSGTMPALPSGLFASAALAYDMVYGKTPFLDFARSEGASTADGLGMLVEQAAESFLVWRGVRPETPPVIALLRRPA